MSEIEPAFIKDLSFPDDGSVVLHFLLKLVSIYSQIPDFVAHIGIHVAGLDMCARIDLIKPTEKKYRTTD
ncbi:hypothetical protein AF72_03545 [Xylella taiwanensis]|uniref:Uncharacterized protein n=1 Tax=Xylella taiwanensis TaxID=1444770 RepID=Z9JJR6_9GAMM|nr:hypothetical protein AB672_03270 [Xylella taiwanensis]EWS78650.1 hypothetical protein AF72_03545 [Xylella taiwanensis]